MKAEFNNQIIAQSNETIVVEGNHYFPPNSINQDFFQPTDLHTSCPWKGEASYYSINVDGKLFENGAWYYPEPKEAAKQIKNYIAFYPQVKVSEG